MSLIRTKGNFIFIDCLGVDTDEKLVMVLKPTDGRFKMSFYPFKDFKATQATHKMELTNKDCENFKIVLSKYGSLSLLFQTLEGKFRVINLWRRPSDKMRHPNDFISFYSTSSLETLETAPPNFKCTIPCH